MRSVLFFVVLHITNAHGSGYFLNCELCWLQFLLHHLPNGICVPFILIFLAILLFFFVYDWNCILRSSFMCCTTDSRLSITRSLLFMFFVQCSMFNVRHAARTHTRNRGTLVFSYHGVHKSFHSISHLCVIAMFSALSTQLKSNAMVNGNCNGKMCNVHRMYLGKIDANGTNVCLHSISYFLNISSLRSL